MTQSNKSNDLKFLIITAVVTASVTTFFNWLLWKKQFASGKDQTLFEHQLTASEAFTKSATRLVYLLDFKERIELEQAKLEVAFRNKTNTDTVKYIDYQQRLIWQDQLQKKYPLIYDNYLKALDSYNEYLSSQLTVQSLFNPADSSMFDNLRLAFSNEYEINTVKKVMKEKKIAINEINDDEIVSTLNHEQNQQLSDIEKQLKLEIAQH